MLCSVTQQLYSVPNRHLLVKSKQWKHQNNVSNLLKVNSEVDVNDVVVVSSLLTLNIALSSFFIFLTIPS